MSGRPARNSIRSAVRGSPTRRGSRAAHLRSITGSRSRAAGGVLMLTTLITGASSGIGLELARIAAAHGHDLVLVARREQTLNDLARELQAQHAVRVHVVGADLSRPGAPAALVARLSALNVEVDVLVNNAGFGLYGRFADTPLDTELQM